MLQAVQHAFSDDASRGIDVTAYRRFEQLGLRVFHENSANAAQTEHAAVIAAVARYEDGCRWNAEMLGEPGQRFSLTGMPREHVQKALARIHDDHVEPGAAQLLF